MYELLNERSEPMSLVLKTIPHGAVSAVTGMLPSMEREWAIGHRLALYCTTPTGGVAPNSCPSLCRNPTGENALHLPACQWHSRLRL